MTWETQWPTGGVGTGGQAELSILSARINALSQFAQAAEPYLTNPEEKLRDARELIDRVGQRLALSGGYTVVALAGPTGCGKSSLFNALAGMNLSPVGVRRPSTDQAYACVWGALDGAKPVLDWLDVPASNRFVRENGLAEADQAELPGLVLLDLPDFDSVEHAHATEVNRVLDLVDLVVWVVDPQKYADRSLHQRQLTRFRRHREVTLVALNQADLLRADDLSLLLKDLRGLLSEEGLAGVPVVATSAVDLPAGLAELRAGLEQAVVRQQATLRRLGSDIDRVVEDLADLVGPPAGEQTASQQVLQELADGLAEVAGVTAISEAVEAAYRRRAAATMGWPLLRWLRKLRVQPLPGFGLTTGGFVPRPGTAPGATSDRSVAQRVVAGLAARAVATRVSDGLPFPWPDAIAAASRSQLYQLPDALTEAVEAAASRLRADLTPTWWRLVGVGQWLLILTSVVGLGWLVAGWMLYVVALPVAHPQVGPVSAPVLLIFGSLLAGGVTEALSRSLAGWTAKTARGRAERRLQAAVGEIGRRFVLTPVQAVLRAYGQARESLYNAAGLR